MITLTGNETQVWSILHEAIEYKWDNPAGVSCKFDKDANTIIITGLNKTKQELIDACSWFNTNQNTLKYDKLREEAIAKIQWELTKAIYHKAKGNNAPMAAWVAKVDAIIAQYPES
jgi:hypothetical protein